MHLLETAGGRFLLDAGLFQGRRTESHRLNSELPLDPRRLDGIILSHAHIDHSGRLPLLLRHGFHGPIWATPATRDLTAIMLPDSARIQESDVGYLRRHGHEAADPLYNMADALAVQDLMLGVPYRRIQHVRKHLAFEFTDAGHILGSASIDLRITEGGAVHRLVFSGDIGRFGLPIIRDPMPPSGPVDTLIVESTYADRDHDPISDAQERLAALVERVAARGGKVLIPAFAVGRTQELVYSLHQLWRNARIPRIPIFIDSPLAVDATAVFRMHPEVFDRREQLLDTTTQIFDFPLVRYLRDASESRQLNTLNGPAVIIAASGMVEAGRILHHIRNHGTSHRNAILFVGFQAEHTLGRRIQEGGPVRVLGEDLELKAEIQTISGYSAHADRNELKSWLTKLGGPIGRAFCVHGEPDQLEAMAELLREHGVKNVVIPKHGQRFELS